MNDTQHNDALRYTECPVLFLRNVIMLSVVMLKVVMLNVVKLSVVMLIAVAPVCTLPCHLFRMTKHK
jgi:hypothetical protein